MRVLHEAVEVIAIGLAKDAVDPFAAAFAAFIYEGHIVRRNHHGGIAAYMVGNAIVWHAAGCHFLFTPLPLYSDDGILKSALDAKAIRAIFHAVLLLCGEVAFGVAEVINSIEQGSLAAAVGAGDAGNILSRKEKQPLLVIAKLGDGNREKSVH